MSRCAAVALALASVSCAGLPTAANLAGIGTAAGVMAPLLTRPKMSEALATPPPAPPAVPSAVSVVVTCGPASPPITTGH